MAVRQNYPGIAAVLQILEQEPAGFGRLGRKEFP